MRVSFASKTRFLLYLDEQLVVQILTARSHVCFSSQSYHNSLPDDSEVALLDFEDQEKRLEGSQLQSEPESPHLGDGEWSDLDRFVGTCSNNIELPF